MRIVFLGNEYNRLSIGCLLGLGRLSEHNVVVGIHYPEKQGVIRTIRKAKAAHGWRFVFRRAADFAWARYQTLLPRKSKRSQNIYSLSEAAHLLELRSFACDNINSAKSVEEIRSHHPDLLVVAAFNQILKRQVIGIPRHGAINVHPSALPRYRGPNPFFWVIHNRERMTGVTVHYIDEGIDSGDIILQKEVRISPGETEASLRDKAIPVAASALLQAVKSIEAGTVRSVPQDEAQATYFGPPPRSASTL